MLFLMPNLKPRKTTGELNIKCDAKFYIKLAARGKANIALFSDIWSLIDRLQCFDTVGWAAGRASGL